MNYEKDQRENEDAPTYRYGVQDDEPEDDREGRETGLQGSFMGITLANDTLADCLFSAKPVGPEPRLT